MFFRGGGEQKDQKNKEKQVKRGIENEMVSHPKYGARKDYGRQK